MLGFTHSFRYAPRFARPIAPRINKVDVRMYTSIKNHQIILPNIKSPKFYSNFNFNPSLNISRRFYSTEERRYTSSHEWIKVENGKGVIGISAHASEALGDIVFVELPSVGEKFSKGEAFATVESVKAASDIYLPVDGTVEEINTEIEEKPTLLNESPFVNGWLAKISLHDESQLDSLLTSDQYNELLEAEKK